MSSFVRRGAGVLAVSMLLGGLTGCGGVGGGAAASCAAVIEYDGHTYLGAGGLRRDPELTGRSMPAVLPGCDDTGGQAEAEPDATVRVLELTQVDAATAVLFRGSVYVRRGRDLPDGARRWFRAPHCTTAGTFRMTGDWLGVTGPKEPRFDGDVRVPYRVELHVTSGPERYVGSTIPVHAGKATDPTLTATDVKSSLWQGGQVSASIRCAGRRFDALALRAR